MGTDRTPPRKVKRHVDVHTVPIFDLLKRLKQTGVAQEYDKHQ